MVKPPKSITLKWDETDVRTFKEWAGEYFMTSDQFFHFLMDGYRNGLIFVLPREASHLIKGGINGYITRIGKRAGRVGAHEVLFEEGFVSTPDER
jgi:hypothetical protein